MPGTNEFYLFDPNGVNQQTVSAYAADTDRLNGYVNGPANVEKFNRLARQATYATAALAKIASDLNLNMPDDGDVSGFADRVKSAINTTARRPPQIAQTTVATAQNSIDFQWTAGLYEEVIMTWSGLKAPLVSGNSPVINPSFKTNGSFIRVSTGVYVSPTQSVSGFLSIRYATQQVIRLDGFAAYEPLPATMTDSLSVVSAMGLSPVWAGAGLVAGIGMQCNYGGTIAQIQPGAVFTVYAR